MLEAFAGLSTPLVADAACAVVSRCGLPCGDPGGGRRAERLAGGSCWRGTTAAWTCSWRPSAGQAPATCWSSTTADAPMRPASATWQCWRPGRPGSGPGDVGPAPRHARARRDRPSGLQLRHLPGRAGAAGRAEGGGLATARFGAPGQQRVHGHDVERGDAQRYALSRCGCPATAAQWDGESMDFAPVPGTAAWQHRDPRGFEVVYFEPLRAREPAERDGPRRSRTAAPGLWSTSSTWMQRGPRAARGSAAGQPPGTPDPARG